MSETKNYFVKIKTASSGEIYVKDLEAWEAIENLRLAEGNGVAFVYSDTADNTPDLAGGNLSANKAKVAAVYLVPPKTGNLTVNLTDERGITVYNVSSAVTDLASLTAWLYNGGYVSHEQCYASISTANVPALIFGIYSVEGTSLWLHTAGTENTEEEVAEDNIQSISNDWKDILTMYKSNGTDWQILGDSDTNRSFAEVTAMVNAMQEKLDRIVDADPVEVVDETLKITDVQFAKILSVTNSSEE